MTRFRPCIDLHQGQVKQIVGGTLSDDSDALSTNFVSERGAEFYAAKYREDGLEGAHVIQLGKGNREAAISALKAWPDGLQVGGGVTAMNAESWIAAGAAKLIVTSWLFDERNRFDFVKLKAISKLITPEKLVIDLSCRKIEGEWWVATNRWQTVTDMRLIPETLKLMGSYCSEFLIHAADVEGLRGGMDEDLIRFLGAESPLPVTYAGGASKLEDLALTDSLSGGKVDLTIGSALDIFGGDVAYADCVAWNKA